MKTLHRYLLSQVLATLLLTVAIFTAVLLMGNVMKEVLALVVKGQASLWGVTKAFALLIPFVISFSLPMGLLTAMLLVFGRFSADQELTAARAGGISLLSLVTPLILLSVLLTGLSAWINLQIAPQCRTAYKKLVYDLAKANPTALLAENTFVTEVPGHVIYIDQLSQNKTDPHQWTMKNITINRVENGELIQRTRASRGEVGYDKKTKQFTFRLFEAQVNVRSDKLSILFGEMNAPEKANENNKPVKKEESPEWIPMAGGEIILPVSLSNLENRIYRPKLSYLTFGQLREKLERHGKITNIENNGSVAYAFCTTPDLPNIGMELDIFRKGKSVGRARFTGELMLEDSNDRGRKIPETKLILEILDGSIQLGDRFALDQTPFKFQMHRQVSFSFAAIGFTLISIPLGIRTHRRETTAGIAMALALVLLYYTFIILGQALEGKPHFYPHFVIWVPVFLFQFVGGWLLFRSNRGV